MVNHYFYTKAFLPLTLAMLFAVFSQGADAFDWRVLVAETALATDLEQTVRKNITSRTYFIDIPSRNGIPAALQMEPNESNPALIDQEKDYVAEYFAWWRQAAYLAATQCETPWCDAWLIGLLALQAKVVSVNDEYLRPRNMAPPVMLAYRISF